MNRQPLDLRFCVPPVLFELAVMAIQVDFLLRTTFSLFARKHFVHQPRACKLRRNYFVRLWGPSPC
jgi:hypothetical protein